jgi:hypothetical protein
VLIERDPARDTEDVLRALGAVLDAHRARGIVIREVPDGLLVRALVPPHPGAPLEGALVPMERLLRTSDIFTARMAAVARRGTDHRAGPIERALRQVGRAIDAGSLTAFVVLQREWDGAWLVWHGLGAYREAQLVTFGPDDIDRLEAAAAGARMPIGATPFGDTAAVLRPQGLPVPAG